MRKFIGIIGLLLAAQGATAVDAAAEGLLSPNVTAPQFLTGTVGFDAARSALASAGQNVPSDKAAPRKTRMIAFEQHGRQLRIDGENDVVRMTFHTDAREAGSGGSLHLSYRNAVSVMPEASTISVAVNGAKIGSFPVRSPFGFSRVDFAVPPAILKEGTNEVVISGVQHHRVDCSMEATYELWTEFDNQHSGFVAGVESGFDDFASLRTVGHTADGVTELRLVLPRNAGVEGINHALPLVQAMTLLLNRQDVTVRLAEAPGTGPGIDLLIGLDDQPQTLAQLPEDAPAGISIRTGASAQRAVVVLRAATADQLPAILLEAIQAGMLPVMNEARSAGFSGVIDAQPRKTYRLAETGFEPHPFAGRLFRTGFAIDLPADFYPADYATIDIGLHAATSAGLDPTSQLLVRVNGRIVKSLPMRDTDGQVFAGRRLELPLRAFHPGRNQVELLAELENASDRDCTYATRDDVSPRFILLDTTEIAIPALARMARMPELAATTGAAWPYSGEAPLSVHTVQPEARSISSAITMVARLALAAGEPLNAKFAFGLPDAKTGTDEGNALVVASRRAIEDHQRLGSSGFNNSAATIQYAQEWDDPDQIITSAIGINPAALESVTVDPSALLQAFRNETRKNGGGGMSDLGERLSGGFSKFLAWLNYQRPVDDTGFAANARLANITQGPTVGGTGVVTWLTADTPLDLSDATVALADPSVWYRLEGEKVTLNIDTREVRTELPGSYFSYHLGDHGVGNLRRIAAAWLSDHFRIYVALVLGLMAVFAVWLGHAVRQNGVRSEK